MGSGERREREKDEVRTRILDVARELFAQEGVESVTMRRIADGLEYTPGALYRHFPDKAALLQALVVTDYAAFSQAFQTLGRIADPLERIRRAGEAYVAFGLTHPHHYRLLFMTAQPKEGPVEPVAPDAKGDPRIDAYEFLDQAVHEASAAHQLRPDLTDLDSVTRLLWAGVHGVVSLAISRDGWPPRAVRALARLMVDVLIRGLAAPRKTSTRHKSRSRR